MRYALVIRMKAYAGVATAGVAFFDASGARLEVFTLHVTAAAGAPISQADAAGDERPDEQGDQVTATVDAPQGSAAAAVFAGKLDGECGEAEVPARLLTCQKGEDNSSERKE